MIISEKQIIILIQCLRDALYIHSKGFTYDAEQRLAIYNQIINQQYEKLIEIIDE
jgi:hypothetical protein